MVVSKINRVKTQSEIPREDWEKTVQKVCENLLRNMIENSGKSKQITNLGRVEEILNLGIKPLVQRPNDIFFNKLIDYSFKNK